MAAAVSSDFWSGRRVFLTGHSGFKGGWLSLLLHRLGAHVTGYALDPPNGPSLFSAARIGECVRSIVGDVRDAGHLAAEMRAAEPEIVIHLAAQPLVRRARLDPVETYTVNVMGTVNLLEAIRGTPSVEAAVIVTSDKVYENCEWSWAYREIDRLGGKEPYGASKAAAEIVVQSYRHSFFNGPERVVQLATARAGNVIGGGDWAEDRLVPDAIRAFAKGEPLVIRYPGAVRPWQHVLEPVSGYCRLAEAMCDGKSLPGDMAFNFGPASEDARPVSWVADELCRRWGEPAAWRHDGHRQPYEARLLEVDSSRARRDLGWEPLWRLSEGLERTVHWYSCFYRDGDVRQETLAQVEDHLGH